ncbi:MAG: cation:proton antiporter [Treponema sp.]|jgi:Kef-type K+ transport system membrane component KefB/mannitol/fructose-specific phosphotransferase system IIA component (Ntr-type)|nr:cation:proton antiporter [Treponema sp.]
MESESISSLAGILTLQVGIIIFAARFFGRVAKKIGMPQVLGELITGIIIGPYAFGSIHLPGFPHGIFALAEGSLAVSNELYAIATIASIILLFASGLETDIGLFLRYSMVGGIIGIGGVVVSFTAGNLAGAVLLNASFTDPRCLFFGILSTATSVGITARILSDQKKMDSPEGVTILAAAVFDDVLGIIALAIVLGIVALLTGSQDNTEGLKAYAILAIAGKAFGIWLGFTALGLAFSKKLAGFLKLFRNESDFSVLALGIALILAGVFEKQGLAMIIGAYIAGLSLSKTDIAIVIQERIRGVYEFFVPVFFAVMGMMVNIREIISPTVLFIGAIYTGVAVVSKVIGCGGPALLLGFNGKGAFRIGAGMVPRGEVALIIAGIGISSGIINEQLFAVVILMTLITTLAAPPLLTASLKLAGSGTRNPVKGGDSASMDWEFSSREIADLVINKLLDDLRKEGFFIQVMNIDEGLSQARKDNVVLSISENDNVVTIETARANMPFVKRAVYEVVVELSIAIQKLKDSSDPFALKTILSEGDGMTREDLLTLITSECFSIALKGETEEEIAGELVDLLNAQGKLLSRDLVLNDILEREKVMSTVMEHGIALPHAKTDGIDVLTVAAGIKKEGIDLKAPDGKRTWLFVLSVIPKKNNSPYLHLQLLASIATIFADEPTRKAIYNAPNPEVAARLLRTGERRSKDRRGK